jgi:hypothetical protein
MIHVSSGETAGSIKSFVESATLGLATSLQAPFW